jgi:hypothetical protein
MSAGNIFVTGGVGFIGTSAGRSAGGEQCSGQLAIDLLVGAESALPARHLNAIGALQAATPS